MDNLSVSSDEEEKPTNVMKNQLNFKEKTQNNTLNEDTARFLVSVASQNREKERKEGHKELFRSHHSKCGDLLGKGVEEIPEGAKKTREEES